MSVSRLVPVPVSVSVCSQAEGGRSELSVGPAMASYIPAGVGPRRAVSILLFVFLRSFRPPSRGLWTFLRWSNAASLNIIVASHFNLIA